MPSRLRFTSTTAATRRARRCIEAHQSGDVVEFTARAAYAWGPSFGLRDLHIEVRLPKDSDLKVETGDGGIDGSELDGRCDAASGDGAITLAGRCDALKARSGDGKIEVSAARGSTMASGWSVQSGDSAIEVALPGDLRATVDASTGNGHVGTDIPITVAGSMSKTRVQGTLNGGGQSLTIHTGDGSVRLRQS
jgi:hypothetical protein